MAINKDKLAAIKAAMGQIEKDYGKGAVMMLGEHKHLNIETTPTGSLALDIALGWWLPKGRIIEIYGPESSGKTTLTLHAIAEIQKAGWVAAFIDAEHALDPLYSARIGVDVENLIIAQPDNGEQALEIVEKLINSSAVDIIVIDSVAALTPRAEIEGEMGDSHMGLQARLMSQALRKLTAAISRTGCTVIFINQIRMKIGVMFGNPETTTGWNALKFYASVRLDIRRRGKIETWTGDTKSMIGSETEVKVVKNKVAAPFRTATFDIMFNEGISKASELVELWVKYGIVTKSWAFFTYGEKKLGQGKENAKKFLKDNATIAKDIEKKIRDAASKVSLVDEIVSEEDNKKNIIEE